MVNTPQLLCFTDLDGTLLNHDDYRYDAAIPVIQKLQALGIPIIPNTSKTRAEVIDLRRALGLSDPFVVENGSGIFLKPGDPRFNLQGESSGELEQTSGELEQICLGVTYSDAKQGLKRLRDFLGESLPGFNTMTEAELVAATNLLPDDLRRACDREFSEPFIRSSSVPVAQLEFWAEQNHFKLLVGNRFCHLLGEGAGKGRAVKVLKDAYRTTESVLTIGLGDSPNDLSMLEAVDIPIVIPGAKGPHPQLNRSDWAIAPARGCRGWAAALEDVLLHHGL